MSSEVAINESHWLGAQCTLTPFQPPLPLTVRLPGQTAKAQMCIPRGSSDSNLYL